jgi:hypothetical protein
MLLLIVDDRHAEGALRQALAAARASGPAVVVLTSDALLAMRLRREGIDARLTVETQAVDERREVFDNRDAVALDGVNHAFGSHAEADGRDFGPYLQYTLIPAFMRAIRNVTAVDDVLSHGFPDRDDGPPARLMLVGGGPLVAAARLVAARRGLQTEAVAGDFLTRALQAFARLRAGRAIKWVGTDFRALVLEPGFIWLLFLKGLWQRAVGSALPASHRRAFIVVGDRFTADVVERVRGEARPIVLAGATQPGRALFDDTVRLKPDTTYASAASSHAAGAVPLEVFTEAMDLLRWIGAAFDAIAQAIAVASDRAHHQRFVVAAVPYWPLVGRQVWLHILTWVPALRHLHALTARAARAHPDGHLLTSSDVTAYNRVLIDTVRAAGIPSTGIQHGITGEPNGHSIVHVDTLATWGDQAEAWYRKRAEELGRRQTARFVVTGNPRFDALATRIANAAPRIPNPESAIPNPQSPIPNPKSRAPFTVTVCTGFTADFSTGASESENLLTIENVLEWAKSKDDVRVIHKMHPGEELEYYAEAARTLGWDPLKLTTIREPILYDILEKSDVLVAAYSTTVLESIALGTPAIVVDAVIRRRLVEGLGRVPGVTIALSIEELHDQLDARRAGPAPDRDALRSSAPLRDFISALDGGATERVAALVQITSDPPAPL